MSGHRVPEQDCPRCHRELTGASGLTHDAAPQPGDFTVCIYCGTVTCFTENLALRLATPEELATLTPDQAREIAQIQAGVRMLQRRN